MPVNEYGDRVHNFFARESSLLEQPQSQLAEGSWPNLDDNSWVGNQRPDDVLNLNAHKYNLQDSANVDREQDNYPFHAAHGFNFIQSNLRADFCKSQSPNDQPNLNGYMYGNQYHPTTKNGASFLMVDTDSEQRHLINSGGLSGHELQRGSGSENQPKTSVRSETTVPSVSFDLFGGQQQMNHHQSSMQQPAQQQHLGVNTMQQQQQQLMISKIKGLQRQQQFQQLDLRQQQLHQLNLRQQNLINQVPTFNQESGSHSSTLINGNPVSSSLQYPWTTEVGANLLNRGSLGMQAPSGLAFTPNIGQSQHLVDLMPQQVDQSLFGVPVSSSRGLNANHYSHKMAERSPKLQMTPSSNTLHGNHEFLPDQVGTQDETSISGQKFENIFGHASSQSLNAGKLNVGGIQQVGSIQRNAPQDFLRRTELAITPDTLNEKLTKQTVSSINEASLDPTEEKILFGSDDNIWASFGNAPNMSGESDNGELNGFPSIQCGSWSALMQSAVAETSSSDIGPQEEWTGLMFNNINGSSANQSLSIHNNNVKQPLSLVEDNVRMHSAMGPGSIPLPDDANRIEATGLSLRGQKCQTELDQRPENDVSHRYISSEEDSKWSAYSSLQISIAEGSQRYGNASQHSLKAERNDIKSSSPLSHRQSGTQEQSNVRNALANFTPPSANRVLNINGVDNSIQNSQNHQSRVVQGEAVNGNSFWKMNSVSSSAAQVDHIKSKIGNPEANKEIFNLTDTKISPVAINSINLGGSDILNQWKNANPSAISQGGENLDRMLHQEVEHGQGSKPLNNFNKEKAKRYESENNDMKENSNDSHRSNLSGHTSTVYKETGLSDASDSRSLFLSKQKSTNQLSRKVSAPRKFQYHPMGNLDVDLEPSNGLKQPNHIVAMSHQNSHVDESNFLVQGQSPDPEKLNRSSNEESSYGGFSGYAPNSQNMLELLPKVDQSGDHGAMTPSNSSECDVTAQLPEATNFDVSPICRLQNRSSVSQAFGLQLAPPSLLRLQIPEHSTYSQKAHSTVKLMPNSNEAAETREKSQQMVPTSLLQSPSFSNDKLKPDFKVDESGSGPPRLNQLQNQQITRLSEKMMNQNIGSSLNNNASSYMQMESAEIVLPVGAGNARKPMLVKSWDTNQENSSNDAQERDPSLAASNIDSRNASQDFRVPEVSRRGGSTSLLQNNRTTLREHQNDLGVLSQKAASQFSELIQPNIVESISFPLADDDINVCKVGKVPSELSSIYVSSPGGVNGKEPVSKGSSEHLQASVTIDPVSRMKNSLVQASSESSSKTSPAISFSTQNKSEFFGRSLTPNTHPQQNYGLSNLMKDSKTDPSYRVSKRMKGPDIVKDVDQVTSMAGQQNDHNNMVGNSLGSSSGVEIEGSMMSNFSCLAETSHLCENVASQDILVHDVNALNNSSTSYTSPVGSENPEVSPQMAPSWFNQYGTFGTGQMFHQYHAHKDTLLGPGETPTHGKSLRASDDVNSEEKGTVSPTDACQDDCTNLATIPAFEPEHLSFHSSKLNSTSQQLPLMSSKKRKSSTSDLQPWQEEISNGSQNLWALSITEAEWNEVTNRLPEKVEYDADFLEDVPPLLRSKRRLMLTTKLMQHLFRPPPAKILSTDASSKYESLTYAVSRTVMGDACNIASCSSGLNLPHHDMELLSAKGKPLGGKVIEEMIRRSCKVKNDFERLDKHSSVFETRMECQDLEKFSVINRLAKFHGRGHTDFAENASSQKPLPQRYVTALPMPRNLPDMVQCLSL